jgi:hypothetical protein
MPSQSREENQQIVLRSKLSSFLQWRENNKYTFHFIALLAFLSALPFFEDNAESRFLTDILLILLLFFAIQTISQETYSMVAGIILAGIAILLFTLFHQTRIEYYFTTAIVVTLIFFIVVSVTIFLAVIREREMRRDTIIGAISVYFLLGLTWAVGIIAMMIFLPGSYDITTENSDKIVNLSDYIAYSSQF